MKNDKFKHVMRQPGHGLLTISTGGGHVDRLLGQTTPARGWSSEFSARLRMLKRDNGPWIIGMPSDSGGGICRGAAHGPLHLRHILFEKDAAWRGRDLGDVPCIPQLLDDAMLNAAQLRQCGKALWGRNYKTGMPVSPLNLLEGLLDEVYAANPRTQVLVLGGDHSVAYPVFAAMQRAGLTKKMGVLHIDAHTDLLESRFGVDRCFATWADKALPWIRPRSAWVQLGIRASRFDKQHWESKTGLQQFWASEVIGSDPHAFADQLVAHYQSLGCRHIYVSHDIDGTDSQSAPSTGTAEPNGLQPVWVATVLKRVTRALPLVGADMVEVAPVIGSASDALRTLNTAVRYIRALNWKIKQKNKPQTLSPPL